jgi:peptidoglycan hydrolase-like protein with peptidoglycan-binding domain
LFPVGVSFIENFGPLTKKACVSYQSLRNLPMSGIIDAKTVACLQQEFA